MNEDACYILEYKKIIEMLQAEAGSFWGKELAGELKPSNELMEINARMEETAAACNLLQSADPPLGGVTDIRPQLKKARLGAFLEADEFVSISNALYAVRRIKNYFREREESLFRDWAMGLELLGQLERDLSLTFDEHGNFLDTASPELAAVRREIRADQSKIKTVLQGILHAQENQKYFQDAIITIRENRYVIPVKLEYRHAFPGVVHDQSSTGATLFIEPMQVVQINNKLKQAELEEKQEINRILRALSGKIKKEAQIILRNMSILAKMDMTVAKAKLARKMLAVQPLLNEEGITELHGARHPLLDAAKAVPIDLFLGEKYRTLLITGPNTGGKTVTLKTLGLLALMAQSGLFIPVQEGSRLAVYRHIYADIGDEQSIEQSLSTFSAHMTHIVKILSEIDRDDLLLLDEVGAGTDPEEGASLAMAILENLLQRGVSVLATTHYSELKTFAYSTEGVENACVEFDVESLRPTYRLLIGIPGASNAFAISRRLGLPESLILRAGELIQADHAQFENVMNELEKERKLYELKNREIAEREQESLQLQQKLEKLRAELQQKKNNILRQAREESNALVQRTRREAEEIIQDLKEQFNDSGIRKRQEVIQNSRAELKQKAAKLRTDYKQADYHEPVDLKRLREGDKVYVLSLQQKGVVLEILGRELLVELGSMKLTVKASSCRFVSSAAPERDEQHHAYMSQALSRAVSISRELDIRGLMVDEGEQMLGKFIDDAMLAGMKELVVIHGKGTGALRKGIHQYLKNHKAVSSFNFADAGEGGTGATVVQLK